MSRLPDSSVHCCVTSPPYWGLRDYGVAGQIGLESSPDDFIEKMVAVFREVRRVLTSDGTCWINLGDSYVSGGGTGNQGRNGDRSDRSHTQRSLLGKTTIASGLKPKDMVGMPWRVALALQADGWWLRQDIIWHKPNPMPESIRDRCTKAHEYVFLMTKSERYFWDFEAMQEPVSGTANARVSKIPTPSGWATGSTDHTAIGHNQTKRHPKLAGVTPKAAPANGEHRPRYNESFAAATVGLVQTRNRRSVWTVQSDPYPEAHFATYPPALIRPMILAGSPIGGTVLDPFGGSGTTGQVAIELGRNAILIELNPEYVELAKKRTDITPGLKF